MEFCEKCGGMILVTNDKAACVSCGHKPKRKIRIQAFEKIQGKESIAVVKEGSDNTYPIVQIKCPKCKSREAFFWTQQTRASDEAETKFYKCVKCTHSWRIYR